MSAVTDTRDRTAIRAADRLHLAGVALGVLGIASLGSVVARLTETWRVSPQAAAHHVTLVGLSVSYPTANLDAIVVLVLAAFGLAALVRLLIAGAGELVRSLRFTRGLEPHIRGTIEAAQLLEDAKPRAFCAGLLRPRIYVTTGAVQQLDADALAAVLEHERHHARRRDPLRLAAARAVSSALFFVPGLREIVRQQLALAELSADECAVAGQGAPALARAMLAFADSVQPGVGFDNGRIDQLLGDPPPWRFPGAVCAGAAAVLLAVAAVGVLAGEVAAGSATLAPPFLSKQPCIVVLAALAVASLMAAAAGLRRATR
jgi:Zn-dependent protease with chaperone function